MLFIIGVIFTSSLVSSNFTSRKSAQMAANEKLNALELAFNQNLNKDRQAISSVTSLLVEDQEMKKLFSQRNRKKLYNYIVPVFDKLKKNNGVVFFNFILPNGDIFLKAHNPSSFGDTISRLSYRRAKKSKDFGVRISWGEDSFVLSTVYACYQADKLIGYLELASGIAHWMLDLKSMIKSENIFILKNRPIGSSNQKQFSIVDSTMSNPEQIVQRLYSSDDDWRYSKEILKNDPYHEHGVVSAIFVVNDSDGKVIGNIVSLIDISHISEMIKRGHLITLIIVTLASIFSGIFIYLFIDQKIVKRLVKLTKLTGLVGQGDLTVREDVLTDRDEFDLLAKNFNKMIEDLGARTFSSEYLKKIFNSLTEMLFIISDKGKIEYVNKKAVELLGYSDSELLDTHLDGVIESTVPNQFPMNFIHLRNKIETKEVRDYNLFYRVKSGNSIPVLLSGATLVDNNKKVKIVLSAKDARESRLVNDLQMSQKQLVQAEKLASLGELSASLTHELNNPLSFIKGFNNRIKAKLKKQGSVTDDDIGDLIAEIEYGTQRMSKIIKNFREFSRQSTIEMKICSVNKAIEKVLELFEIQFFLRNIEVEKDLSQDDPLACLDVSQLEQVFINLISNARDAIEESVKNLKKISVGSRIDGKEVHVYFSDTGTGMPEAVRDKIFDPFFTTKEVGKGTGLGLSISHRIISDFQGRLNVQSKEGKGTTFYIKLPLANSKGAIE